MKNSGWHTPEFQDTDANKTAQNASADMTAEVERVINRLMDRAEGIISSVQRLFQRGREQVASLVELKDKTQAAVTPVVAPVLATSRDLSRRVATQYRRDPKPFLIGGALVLGGLALLYLYSRRETEEAGTTEETFGGAGHPEPWRTDSAVHFSGDSVTMQ